MSVVVGSRPRMARLRFASDRERQFCLLHLAGLAHERWFADLADRIALACTLLADRGEPLCIEAIAESAGLDAPTVERHRALVECYRR